MKCSQNVVLKVGCPAFPDSSVGKESTYNAGDPSSIPGSGRSTGEGIDYPLQYSWASLVTQLINNPLHCRRPGFNPWVVNIPWRRERLPTPIFWSGEFHGLSHGKSTGSQRVGHDGVTFTSLDTFGLSCGSVVKNMPTMQETWIRSLGWENPLEKEMATHSSILA